MRCLVTLFAVVVLSGQSWAQQAVDVELVLAADGSGSITEEEMRLQREGYAAAISDPRVLDAIQSGFLGRIAVAYVEWGSAQSQHTIVDWTIVEDAESAAVFAEALVTRPRQATGWNSISNAIHYAAEMIRTNDIEGTRAVIDVSADSGQYGGLPIHAVRDRTVMDGMTINGLAIKNRGGSGGSTPTGMPLDEHFRRDVIGGAGAFVMVADDETSFADAVLNKLLLEIASPDWPGRRAALDGTD